MVLALRTGITPPHLDWADDRVLHTAWALLAEEDREARSTGGAQMSG